MPIYLAEIVGPVNAKPLDSEMIAIANRGYRCFVSVVDFQNYVNLEILVKQEVAA